MIKIADGQSPHSVALHGLLKPRDLNTVYSWLDIYEAEGLDGLIVHQHGGYRRVSLDSAKEKDLRERLRRSPARRLRDCHPNGVLSQPDGAVGAAHLEADLLGELSDVLNEHQRRAIQGPRSRGLWSRAETPMRPRAR